MKATRIGLDIGGTFTDLLCYDDTTKKILIGKVPTTPNSLEVGAQNAIESVVPHELISAAGFFLHGTTVGLNALLERRGAKVGLLTTEGFRDVLELRRGTREDMYNAFWTPDAPLVDRSLRLPVRERVDVHGEILTPLEVDDVRKALKTFEEKNVTAIAISFLHAYANPAHELAAKRVLIKSGFTGAISLSHQVSGEYRNYERTSTTVIDGFVQARMADYLNNVQSRLELAGFSGECLITRSGGGSMSFREARERAFETIMSGPVAGAEGAAKFTREHGFGDMVSVDAGGTSFDTALIRDGRTQLLYQGSVGNMPVQCPWVDVRSIGAGGGSIAYVDQGGLLQVGPQSAGAEPGPACYGRGGDKPTTSDAAFYLGMLGDGNLASGLILDRKLSEKALAPIAGKLGYSIARTAQGIIAIASAAMAGAIRDITVEQGVDPRALKILAFGGAGPLLATELARELDIQQIIVPPYAGNFSAWGLLGADALRSSAKSRIMAFSNAAISDCNSMLSQLFEELFNRGDQDTSQEDWTLEGAIDIRYRGQEHSLTIPLVLTEDRQIQMPHSEILKLFYERYRQAYGELLEAPVECVAVRASLRQSLPPLEISPDFSRDDAGNKPEYLHDTYSFSEKEYLPFAYMNRDSLKAGVSISGPAIIFEPTTTTYVDADFDIHTHQSGSLILKKKALKAN